MIVLNCSVCGGRLSLPQNNGICECEYCGSLQTLPRVDSDQIRMLYNRANHFRQTADFDKAEAIYEQIVSKDSSDPKAHWELFLCRYGIEYVEDPSTFQYMPTCHRTSHLPALEDPDYLMAIKYSSGDSEQTYRKEASRIDRIHKKILQISDMEEPFDIFICYKETDDNGRRTQDSVKAQEIFDALTKDGYKVFFSRVTLKEKIGRMYEPYIFAALNSAKIMIAVGTKAENLNSVWVKNEWKRYLKMLSKGEDKLLIPCYLNMSPYDLPDELSKLQAQDMSQIAFMANLKNAVRKKITPNFNLEEHEEINKNTKDKLLSDIAKAIEEENLEAADDLCNKFIYINPEKPEGYLYKMYVGYKKNWDIVQAGKKLMQLSEHITESEKSIIDDNNYEIFFMAFLSSECISRCRYIMEKYPGILKKNLASDHRNSKIVFYSMLSYAVIKQNCRMVKSLLMLGADPNHSIRIVKESGHRVTITCLSDAICNENAEIIELLLRYHADPNTKDEYFSENGRKNIVPMLSFAVYFKENIEIVRLLLQYGADMKKAERIDSDDPVPFAHSPLFDAVDNCNMEMTELLLRCGADPNEIVTFFDEQGCRYVLTLTACSLLLNENIDIAELLLRYGATLDHVIEMGDLKKVESRFPYKRTFRNKEDIKRLKSLGWKGSIF